MLRVSAVVLAAVVVATIAGMGGQAMAQSGSGGLIVVGTAGPGSGPLGGTDPDLMKKMMEQFQVQAAKQMQEALGATDDEWKALQPKIENVQTLSQQISFPGGMGMGRMFLPTGGDPKETPDITKKLQALRDLVKNKDAKAEEVAAALKDYREAKAKAKDKLAKAQKELKEILTVKQEAVMVAMGVLE